MALLFYDRNAGQGEFYDTDGQGNIALLKSYSGWRTSWTQILPCTAAQSAGPNLFFYDSNAGAAEFYSTDFLANSSGLAQFYSTDGHGGISQLSSSTYSKGWTLIIPCRLGATYTDLLFYDHNRGVGEFYIPDGQGGINLLSSHTGWRTSWAEIVSIDLPHP